MELDEIFPEYLRKCMYERRSIRCFESRGVRGYWKFILRGKAGGLENFNIYWESIKITRTEHS